MNLTKLLKPESIVIVGASENSSFGGDCTRNMFKFSNPDKRIYLVNKNRDTIFGRKCYPTISAINDTIDLCVICTPRNSIIPILTEAARKGCQGAVVYASGYGETGEEGKFREAELITTANDLGIKILGPNCAGFSNFVDGIFAFAFLCEERDRKGNIGFLSQSGQIVLSALDSPQMGFSYVISSGNSANVKIEDYLDFLVDDPDTKVIAAYLEGITNPGKFVSVLEKAAQVQKPIVVLKTGKSEKSKQLAASHTGSLAGSDQALRTLFKKFGVIAVDDIQELYGVATAISIIDSLPKGSKPVYMNVSGGEAGVSADLNELYGIQLANYSEETLSVLSKLIPEYGSINNPFDMTAGIGYNAPVMAEALTAISKDENVDFIVLGYTITPELWDDTSDHMAEAIVLAKEKNPIKPIFWIPFVEHTRHDETMKKLNQCGVPVLPSGHYGFMVIKRIVDFLLFKYEDVKVSIPTVKNQQSVKAFSEYDSLCFLKDFGINIPPQRIAKTVEEALEKAKELTYPLSCKIHSADIQHKSDVGGVKLNIKTPEDLENAFNEIMNNVQVKCPNANIEGVLLKPMLEKGIEIIIGVVNDMQFGPSIMIGLGGVFVELFKDVQMMTAPVSKNQALTMIASLKAYPLLSGYRGSKAMNIDDLADLIVKVSELASANKDCLKELDINPVFVTENGVQIADALMIQYEI